ncbi:MAG: radical SAM/SPASM domain-containing protein [Candidatus Helarchaeota archaeon]
MFKSMIQFFRLNKSIIYSLIGWLIHHPRNIISSFRLLLAYKNSKNQREIEELAGLKVPPVLILSITSRCNLHCKGCYAFATGTVCDNPKNSEKSDVNYLTWNKWKDIIVEAKELGVFAFIIAGGEPFLFPNLLDLCKKFKDRLFLIFTNGTMISNHEIKKLKHLPNVIIIVSIEGGREMTDNRRGMGVYKKAVRTINRLNGIGLLAGISVSITRENFGYWIQEQSIDNLISQGIRIIFFIEYIPTNQSEFSLILNKKEHTEFRSQVIKYRRTKPVYIIHSPGDEEFMGGCISAGRGFAHITPLGDLTPCPVSNIATHNLQTTSLRTALQCLLFKEIREKEHLLETSGVPCALFSHPKEVESIGKAIGAYRTDTREPF